MVGPGARPDGKTGAAEPTHLAGVFDVEPGPRATTALEPAASRVVCLGRVAVLFQEQVDAAPGPRIDARELPFRRHVLEG